MTSIDGNARLRNGRIAVHCVADYIILPPYSQPQLVLSIVDDGASGDLEVIYSPGGGAGCDDNSELADEYLGNDLPTCAGGGGSGGGVPGTPGGTSGGGGGNITCTQYVMEISYDYGQTWTPVYSWWECR